MLQLVDIRKAYTTAAFTQVALDNVSVAFRDNEFAAILGPSGSGKTTLLNILGGLDHADSGDIVINGISTKDYGDKDWDAYRNHRIGFIFQSYNLIPHQTVLSNVELALTLSGEPAAQRKERALAALDRVGLTEHADKRPNQLSGGQMQRVAIARALVNDPDIVLADEPTGALDTDTGIQVMELLAEIARDRLVVMVTHNPELAEEYATRIIRLRDGRIVDDTDPIRAEELSGGSVSLPAVAPLPAGGRHFGGGASAGAAGGRTGRAPSKSQVSDATRHASMGFLTALALSFNNLMTKKGRTFMTAFAGSIGIIGIAAILALSNGVNDYIANTEEEALSSYPLTITKSSFDLTSLMMANMGTGNESSEQAADEREIKQYGIMANMFAQVKNNDLRTFRAYLESGDSGIEPYVNSIQYSYGIAPQIYKADTSKGIVKLNPSRMSRTLTNGLSGSAFLGGQSMSSFTQLLDDRKLLEQSLELVEGRWPERYDECLFVLNRRGGVTDYTLYSLGVYDTKVMDDMTTKALNGETVEVPDTYETFTRDDALALHFSVIPAADLYQYNGEQHTWTDMTSDRAYMRKALGNAVDLHVVGIVKQTDGAGSAGVTEGIAYTPDLTLHLMAASADSDIVRQQKANQDVDVFTGKTFEELQDEENRNLDLESVFSVDEDALREAFSFDESALDGLGEGLDLSGMDLSSALGDMDLSGLDLSGMDLSSMDLSEMDLSSIDLSAMDPSSIDMSDIDLSDMDLSSVIDEESMKKILLGAPKFAGADPGTSSEDSQLSEEQMDKIAEAGGKLVGGFVKWLAESDAFVDPETGEAQVPDMGAIAQEYLQTEEAQALLAGLVEELGEELSPEDAEKVVSALSDYLTNSLAPYLGTVTQGLDPSTIDAETIQQLVDNAPKPDVDALSEQIGAEKMAEITQEAASRLASDFTSWLLQHPEMLVGGDSGEEPDSSALVEEYLKTDEAKKTVSDLLADLGSASSSSDDQDAFSEAMQSYMVEFSTYMTTQLGTLYGSAMETMAQTMMQAMGKQIAEAVVKNMAEALAKAMVETMVKTMGTQLSQTLTREIGAAMTTLTGTISQALATQLTDSFSQLSTQLSDAMQDGFKVDADAFAKAIEFNMTQEDLASLLTNLMNADELTYEGNLNKLGYGEVENPESISIYPKDFEAKESVLDIVDSYNDRMEAQGKDDSTIQYSDIAGVLMSSVTDIVNTISLVLIAFVSISLVVSSIMISIITYISVLERKKEIGILRAMGASKLNVANIFNAETVIEGFFAGVLAVLVVYAASVPVNMLVYKLKDVPNIMQLPVQNAIALVGISVVLTLVAGLIPSSAAARRDPVEALRSE